MNTALKDEQIENDIFKSSDKTGLPETAVSLTSSNYGGEPITRRHALLEDLHRLHRSLRGPEELLDRSNYSRPFPPKSGYSKPPNQ